MAKSKKKKSIGIMDFINGTSINKVPWESYTDVEKKAFGPFMYIRWISMNNDLTEVANLFQKYTVSLLDAEHVYKLYYSLLPKQKITFKYFKGKKEDKYNKELITLLAEHYKESKYHVEEYLDILSKSTEGVDELIYILELYGTTEKEKKKMLKF